MSKAFSFAQAVRIAQAFERRRVRFLFLQSGPPEAPFPEFEECADLYLKKSPENTRALLAALRELGFPVEPEREEEILRGKEVVYLPNGPFEMHLVFAPDRFATFEEAEARALSAEGVPVCHINDVLFRADEPSEPGPLSRLKAFRDWWLRNRPSS